MAIIGYLFLAVGCILALGAGIGVLIAAFRESPIWGLGCLLLPLISFVFIVMHWEETKKFFFMNLIGIAGIVLGSVLVHAGS